MLISMPTGTSAIFGVVQVMSGSSLGRCSASPHRIYSYEVHSPHLQARGAIPDAPAIATIGVSYAPRAQRAATKAGIGSTCGRNAALAAF